MSNTVSGTINAPSDDDDYSDWPLSSDKKRIREYFLLPEKKWNIFNFELRQSQSIECLKQYNKFTSITSRIYISSLETSKNLELLQRHKITHILSTVTRARGLRPRTAHFPDKFTYKLIENVADTPIYEECEQVRMSFLQCNDFIHECLSANHENKILIHCNFGASRSITVTTAYLMVVTGLDYYDIITAIEAKRQVWVLMFDFPNILKEYAGVAEYERRRLQISEDMTNKTALELCSD